MDKKQAQLILDKIVGQIFGYKNPYDLDSFQSKFAFDIILPKKVSDHSTGKDTWARSTNPSKFMTIESIISRSELDDWMVPKRQFSDINDILEAWNNINMMVSERQIDSVNLAESDNIYNSENVFRSQDCYSSKKILFCEGVRSCEFVSASRGSGNSTYCIRIEDSSNCNKSFAVSWSSKVSNSFLIQDCHDISDCMLCSHIKSKRFCIANMQFSENEYNQLKEVIINWILN